MTSTKQIMIEEATKARNEIHAELLQAAENGRGMGEWFRDRVSMLNHYNGLLANLGAIPAL